MISEIKTWKMRIEKGKRNQSELISEAERKFFFASLIICAFQFSKSNRKNSFQSVCFLNVVL